MISQIVINTLVLGTSLALVSVGLTLAYGVMHIVNFAHGVFFMLGAYFVYIIAEIGFPVALAVPASVIIVIMLAVPLHFLIFRWVYGEFMGSLLITIGLTLFIQGLVQKLVGPESLTVPSYFGRSFNIVGASITGDRIFVVLAGIIFLAGTWLLVFKSRAGLQIRAVEQDREVAGLYGVSTEKVSLFTLMLSFGLAAAAGALMSPLIFLDPYIADRWTLLAFAVVILGGLGSVMGSFVASIVLGAVLSLAQTYSSMQVGELVFFALVGIVLLVRPTGLMGRKVVS